MLHFKGILRFRQRILFSLISQKAVRISEIRSQSTDPGLKPHEILFLKLISAITNGCQVEINYSGTQVVFRPGSLYGGEVDFDCECDRGISWFLEPILVLGPFCKFAPKITLYGITAASDMDQSVDSLKNLDMKILAMFLPADVREGVDLKINGRGAAPLGGGSVFFTCPIISTYTAIQQTSCGQIKRIRGVSSTTRISPQISNRMIEASKQHLSRFLQDIYIYSDVFKGTDAGLSPGYSLFLLAESTNGAIYGADGVGKEGGSVEDMSLAVCKRILKTIKSGGFVDANHEWALLLRMALCCDALSKVILGCPLNSKHEEARKDLLADIKEFFGVTYKQTPVEDGIVLSCVGCSLINMNKRTQ